MTGVQTCALPIYGAERVVEIDMTEEEMDKFKKSNNVLREYMSHIGY